MKLLEYYNNITLEKDKKLNFIQRYLIFLLL